jgi:hypothetical protein
MTTEAVLFTRRRVPKLKFSQTEDAKLADLVAAHGDQDWTMIANAMANRSVRQCRERWVNYLAPSVINGIWSADDDALLLEKYRVYGSHWKPIASFFPGRTDINVKNHYMTLVRRQSVLMAQPSPLQPAPERPPEPGHIHEALGFIDLLFERQALEWDFVTHHSEDFPSPASQRSWYWEYGFPIAPSG